MVRIMKGHDVYGTNKALYKLLYNVDVGKIMVKKTLFFVSLSFLLILSPNVQAAEIFLTKEG